MTGPVPGEYPPADLVVLNGRITTLAVGAPEEAEALAVRGGRIVAVGPTAEIARLAGPGTVVLDCAGRRVVPGLIDAHTHVVRAGFTWNQEVRWGTVTSLREGLDAIRARAAATPAGGWVAVVGGWHPSQFAERRPPTRDEVEAVAPDHAVLVQFLYEWAMVNRRGRELVDWSSAAAAGVDPATIERDADGHPTGLVRALPSLRWLYGQLPAPTFAEQVDSTEAVTRELASMGITGVIDGGGSNTGPDVYRPLYETWRQDRLPIRVRLTLHGRGPRTEEPDIAGYLRNLHPGQGDDRLRVLGVGEIVLWSLHDGFNRYPDLSAEQLGRLEQLLRACAEARMTVHLHLIRPETTAATLDLWERIDREVGMRDLRWAIVHGHSVRPEQADRLARLGAAVIGEALLRLEGDEVRHMWGADALRAAPPMAALAASGVAVAAGSDAFRVASYNPFATLQWLTTGRTASGTQIWDAANRVGRRQALEMMTTRAAWCSFEERSRGRLQPGYLADLAVLTDDFFAVPDEQIPQIRSELTVVGGEVVWSSGRMTEPSTQERT
jgi:predicted amidohydrolase YtcJ